MRTKSKRTLPDGYVQIDEAIRDISNLVYMHRDNITIVRSLNLVHNKLNVTKEIISYNPRLPFQQIEKRIIELCKDATCHGVNITISFIKKYPENDKSKFGYLQVNI